jgi:septation ring formation regulator EzrA
MTTTLFAIFAIALVAAMAWVITRIVKIFVELEELHQQARNTTERADNHCSKVNKLKEQVEQIQQTQAAIAETLVNASETIARLSKANKEATECIDLLNKKVGTLQIEMCAASLYIPRTPKQTDAKKKKMDRLAKYTELRANGLSIRKAGEEVGVSYPTAKRYEKQRKAQSNENGNN